MRDIPIITLTTDFGTADAWVGAMKGVILAIAPAARLVDVTHEVPPQRIAAGALVLGDAWRCFPAGTVHLAVVDPGVGTARRAIAVEAEGMLGVGPDNGLLTPLLEVATRVVEIRDDRLFRRPVAPTFHGRDVFAPVAAHLALGLDPGSLGPEVRDACRLEAPRVTGRGDGFEGEVIHVDRFGNLVTAITAGSLAGWDGVDVEIAGFHVPGLARSYESPAADGTERTGLRALVGSSGRLEIALPGGSAARVTGAVPGTPVRVVRRAPGRRQA